jgi:hypothetical protein
VGRRRLGDLTPHCHSHRLPGLHGISREAAKDVRLQIRIPWVLLTAGVPTVVLSRWRVDAEATGRWIGRSHATLTQGVSSATSLLIAVAQLTLEHKQSLLKDKQRHIAVRDFLASLAPQLVKRRADLARNAHCPHGILA